MMRFFLEKSHETRLRMIQIGNELLHSDKVSDSRKKVIKSSMKASFSWWPMTLIVFTMPFFLMKNGLAKNAVHFANDSELEKKYALFQDCHGKSLMAANPIFSVIAILEIIIFLLVKGMREQSVE